MELPESAAASSIPFTSKEHFHKTPKKPELRTPAKSKPSDLIFSATKTPEKSVPPNPRTRNRSAALPISDIRQAALNLQRSNLRSSGEAGLCLGLGDRVLDYGLTAKSCPSIEPKKNSILPEKCEMLCGFFNAMVSSIQLLRLKRSSAIFTNISQKVESLTDRRFTVNHLAQLKHILPEAIVVKIIRVKDEETCCMKEELHITLDADSLRTNNNDKGVSGPSLLKTVFRTRIMEYYETHSVVDDIPEGTIPGLFYPPKQPLDMTLSLHDGVSIASQNPSFRKHFSDKLASAVVQCSTTIMGSLASFTGEDKTSGVGSSVCCSEESKSFELCTTQLPQSYVASTPAKDMDCSDTCLSSKGADNTCKTPARLYSTPARLMAATPSLRPEKRCYMTPDDNDSCSLPCKLVRRLDRIKSLSFDSPDTEDDAKLDVQTDQLQGSVVGSDLDFLPRNLLQAVREEEQRILEEQDPAISQAKRQLQLMAQLPHLIDMIHLLFQSINRSVLTKEEFIYKIVVGHRGTVDRAEVEEQLKLLQELAPDYISEEPSLSGDTLISLNKFSSTQSIRAKLLEAK